MGGNELPARSESAPYLSMSKYKDDLTASMDMLAQDPLVRFVGYGLVHGRAGGTMKNVPEWQIMEMPTAENLMTGVAIGLSITGLKPVLYFERADFLLNAADAIVNHLAAMNTLSGGEFNPTCIIRVTIGNSTKPLFTGPVHTQDLSRAFDEMLPNIPIYCVERDEKDLKDKSFDAMIHDPLTVYTRAFSELGKRSTMIFERKDLW